ncbi:hypothetical protein [Demequina lutea]|uniref:SPOR domain-containing protein n=1 Tax=Demequina lutea TaxID=431489 RepID=A0A7Y9ZD51_9MICO|nr:hypothetical protein [Demequina lutea]NYI41171.1 hypothetical protein [Demequina lutea]
MEQHRDKIEYFFNTTTGLVEEGRQSSWEHLLGPFATPEAASHALEIVAKRSAAWDDEDKAWRGED